jgi:GTPase SAR1 family protein
MQGINEYCEAYGFRAHFETSSKENIGVQQSFQRLIREVKIEEY